MNPLSGAGPMLAVLLTLAAAAKLADSATFELEVRRVMSAPWCNDHPRLLAQAARAVALSELCVATAVVFGGRPGLALGAAVAWGFSAVVGYAIRRGASCACWGSLSPTRAGNVEIARAAFLDVLLTAALISGRSSGLSWWIPGWLAAYVAIGHLGARFRATVTRRRYGCVPATGILRAAAFLLAAPALRCPRGNPPLWPWRNRRVLRRWRRTAVVRDALAVHPGLDPAWHRAVIRSRGGERYVEVRGWGGCLSLCEAPSADLSCQLILFRTAGSR